MLVGPDEGETAEGELGVGRMAEPEEIVARRGGAARRPRAAAREARARLRRRDARADRRGALRRQPLVGPHGRRARRGGARAAARDVTLLGANLAVAAPPGVEVVETPTAAELEREALARGADADVVIMAAAVADYRPAEALATKRPKDAERLDGRARADDRRPRDARRAARARARCSSASRPTTGERGLERAREKLATKNADLFVFNDVARTDIGFDSADNEVTLVSRAPASARSRKAPKERDRGGGARRGGAPAWLSRARRPGAGATSSARSSRTSARVVHASDETLRLVVLCLVAEGHLIIEDFPGVGKTMLAKALARSLDCSFSRLQFTPDLLPSDVTGVNVFDQRTNELRVPAGPGLREPAARRRGEPRVAEDAGGAARVHAGERR